MPFDGTGAWQFNPKGKQWRSEKRDRTVGSYSRAQVPAGGKVRLTAPQGRESQASYEQAIDP